MSPNLAKAAFVGANMVKGPPVERVDTRPAFLAAATKELNPLSINVLARFFGGGMRTVSCKFHENKSNDKFSVRHYCHKNSDHPVGKHLQSHGSPH